MNQQVSPLGNHLDAAHLPERIIALKEYFAGLGVLCLEGSVEKGSATTMVTTGQKESRCIVEEIKAATDLPVRWVVLETQEPPEIFKETIFWNNKGNPYLRALMNDDRPVDAARKLHAKMIGSPIKLTAYLFMEGGLCVVFRQNTLATILFSKYEPPEEELYFRPSPQAWSDEEDEEDEDFVRADPEKIEALARQLGAMPGFGLARNREQREHFADSKLADNPDYKEFQHWDRSDMLHRAKLLFDMEILPARVAELAESGLPQREIAAQAGCSLHRVKAILAAR